MAAGPGRDYDPHEEMVGMERCNGRGLHPTLGIDYLGTIVS